MVTPFRNEPFTDFKRPENRAAYEDALARVEAECGKTYANVIDGERVATSEGDRNARIVETKDPSDPDVVVGRFPQAGVLEARRATAAADAAFPAWSATPWADRAHLLFEFVHAFRDGGAREREKRHHEVVCVARRFSRGGEDV